MPTTLSSKFLEDANGTKYAPITTPQAVRFPDGDNLNDKLTTMGASGTNHKSGLVPDPGSTAGTSKYLREDGTWAAPAGGGNITIESNSAPTSSTLTYTKDGETKSYAVGDNIIVPNAQSETGYDVYTLLHLAGGVATWGSMDAYDGRVIVTVRVYDNDDTNLALTTATISVNGGTAAAMTGVTDTTGHKKTFTATGIEVGDEYTVAFGNVSGYSKPGNISGTKGLDAMTATVTYNALFIDLDLPSGTLWASGNICKDAQGNYYLGGETDYGCKFSWGNTDGHNTSENFQFGEWNYWDYATLEALYQDTGGGTIATPQNLFIAQNTPGATVSADIASNDATHDAALARLGSPCHLPSVPDFQELSQYANWQWIEDYNGSGVNGYKVSSTTDSTKYIFLPAAGGDYWYYDTNTGQVAKENSYVNQWGAYWSSSIYDAFGACCLDFGDGGIDPGIDGFRYSGYSVRAVQ